MIGRLRICIFAHSWISDWNHGNAHFLRGLAYELDRLGHDVRCYEEVDSWSMTNLLEEGIDRATEAFRNFRKAFPTLDVRFYRNDASLLPFLEEQLREADVALKTKLGFRALFHDTHHRAYTNPKEILRMPLARFDGVLAFGEAIRRIYADGFGVQRVWTFHEAADTAHFRPLPREEDTDVIWVGNWGDEERTRELEEFLITPARQLRNRKIAVHGVRYPREAQERLTDSGIEFRGCMCRAGFTPTVCQACLRYVFSRRWHVAFHWCAPLGLTQKVNSARAKTTSVFPMDALWRLKSGICWPTRLPGSK